MLDQFNRSWICVAAVACGIGFLPVPSVTAQEPAPTQATPAPEAPQEITAAGFALEANAVEERLSRIEAQISAIDVTEEVSKALDEIEAAGARLHEEFKGIGGRRAMTSELNTLEQRLEVQVTLTDIQVGRLSKYADGLEALAIQNEQDVEIWRRAYRQTRRASMPKAVRDRTGSILQGLREGGSKLERKQLEVLEVQSRALDVRDTIHQAQEGIAHAKRAQVENVFQRQDPPLWKVGRQADAAQGRTGYDVGFSWTATVEYVRTHAESLIWQLVLVLVLGFVLTRARKLVNARVEKHKESGISPWERRAAEALRHPWAAALLLAFASMRYFEPDRAVDLILVVWAVVIPLWFVVFREMVPQSFRKVLVGVALLGALHILVALASDNLWVERILLLVELLSASAGFGWLVRFLRLVDAPKRVREGLWFNLVALWARIAFVVSVCGVLATIVGYTYFAMDAAMFAVIGTISATAWAALARIVEALVATGVHTGRLDTSRMVRANRDVITRVSTRVIRLLAAAMFFWTTSDITTIWRPTIRPLKRLLAADLGFGFSELGLTVGDLVLFFVVLWVSWVIARFVSFVMREEIFPRLSVKEGVPYALTTFTRYAIIAIGFITAVSVLGVPLDRITIILSALGVGIGFGLQKLVSNVVSGFVLLTERPIRLRDKIQIDEVLGRVSHIGMRASTVRTFDGAEVIIPNDDLTSERVVNFTLSARHQRVILPIGVAYGTDPEQVLSILRKLAASHDKVFNTPEPLTLFRGFGDSALDFELRVFMDPSDVLDVPSELYVAINAALREAGIDIPFPQRDLHVRSVASAATLTGTGTD